MSNQLWNAFHIAKFIGKWDVSKSHMNQLWNTFHIAKFIGKWDVFKSHIKKIKNQCQILVNGITKWLNIAICIL